MGNTVFQAAQGRFVSVFRKPEQRMISHYWMRDTVKLHKPWPEFIRDAEGCQAKVLIGRPCLVPYKLGPGEIQEAVRRVRVGFAFVGILEEWAQMVCLFHKMFGGSCRSSERWKYRQGRKATGKDSDGNYNITVLNGYVDKADARVYGAAEEVFRDNVRKYGEIPSHTGCEKFCS